MQHKTLTPSGPYLKNLAFSLSCTDRASRGTYRKDLGRYFPSEGNNKTEYFLFVKDQYNFCYELMKSYMAWRTRATIKNDYVWKHSATNETDQWTYGKTHLSEFTQCYTLISAISIVLECRAKGQEPRYNIAHAVASNDWNHTPWIHSWNWCITPCIPM